MYAELDFDEVLGSKSFVDVGGHYSRPDLFWLGVDGRERLPVRVQRDGEMGRRCKLVYLNAYIYIPHVQALVLQVPCQCLTSPLHVPCSMPATLPSHVSPLYTQHDALISSSIFMPSSHPHSPVEAAKLHSTVCKGGEISGAAYMHEDK